MNTKKKGFLLIEALYALNLLIIFGLLSALWQVAIVRQQIRTKQLLRAQNWALFYAEQLKGGRVSVGSMVAEGEYTVTVTATPCNPNFPRHFGYARITVYWLDQYQEEQQYSVYAGFVL